MEQAPDAGIPAPARGAGLIGHQPEGRGRGIDDVPASGSAEPPATRRREIFLVSNNVDEMGGVARWQHQMARLFAERGHAVHLVGIVPAQVSRMDLPDHLPYRTTVLYDQHPPPAWRPCGLRGRLRVGARLRQAWRAEGMRRQADRLSRMFATAGPGAVVIVTQVWAMEWVALADTAGLTVIGMSHESFDASCQSSRLGRVQRFYGDVDRMLTLTQEDADRWIRRGMNNVAAMPNPLPVTAPEASSAGRDKVVAAIGRISFEKGVDLLLESWAEVAPGYPDWKLRLYGSGAAEQERLLREQCTRLGLDGSVEWMGQTDDVVGALNEASVFALPSRGEGFPLSLLEAMACAVPCVAFDCAPGVREIVSDEMDGLLAPVGNIAVFARQLRRLMDDRELRYKMGELARWNVQRYAPGEIVARWEDLFDFLDR